MNNDDLASLIPPSPVAASRRFHPRRREALSEVSMFEVELPFPPSVNHYWRLWRGRMVISTEGRAYRTTVAAILRAAGVQPMTGRLAVSIEAFPPDHRRRDLDNLLKAVGDSLQHGGAFPDDSQIVWLLIEKAERVAGGKIRVRITERK